MADVIDYEIFGEDIQYVEVELDPGEAAVGEAGSMMYMQEGITLDTIFGDGSQQGGFFSKLVGAGKRLLTGESLFMTVYTNQGNGKRRLAFAAPYPGRIVPIDLSRIGGTFICQKDSFLCAARGVAVGIAFQKRLGVGFFGGEGFIMEKLEGDGLAFIHAGGMLMKKDLAPGELLRVDTGCLVGMQPTVDYDIEYVGKVKTALFGGEGLFFATLRGPGTVYLQSLPLSRMASRIFAAAPQTGGQREQGSVLGGMLGGAALGGLLGGDDE
ncbi:MAG: TIGR00266 family protein [Burkholderiales bacterium]